MSINNITLNPEMLTSLYTRYLVQEQANAPITTSISKPVTVVYGGQKSDKAADMEFLGGILKACHLSTTQVDIIEPSEANQISDLLLPGMEKLLVFGAFSDPSGFIDFEPRLTNNTLVLTAPALELISQSKELKMKLWNGLKTLFNIR